MEGFRHLGTIVERFIIVILAGIRPIVGRLERNGSHFAAKDVKARRRHVRCLKKRPGFEQHGLQIPGHEVDIAEMHAGSAADHPDDIGTARLFELRLQRITEGKDPLRPVLTRKASERKGNETRRHTVGMKCIHRLVVRTHITVDEGRAGRGTGDDVKTPVGVGVRIRLARVADITVLKQRLGVERQVLAELPQFVRQIAQKKPRHRPGRIKELEVVDPAHVRNFAEQLVGERREHPPGTSLLLCLQIRKPGAEDGELERIVVGLKPGLHVFTADPDAAGMKLIARRPTTTKRDLPVPQDGCGRMASEVDELEELHPVAFRRQNELMLDAIEADLERNVLKRKPENALDAIDDLFASLMRLVSIHHGADLRLLAFEGRPGLLRALPEGNPEERQRHALETVLHEFFGILVLGFGFVRPSEP